LKLFHRDDIIIYYRTDLRGADLDENMASLNIQITSSIGEGSTLLSAFDSALQNAGVSNYNLIRLSSIIPPHSKIEKSSRYQTPPSEFGHKLYVVMADVRSSKVGKFIGAGIGWYQLEDKRGFFVEHEAIGSTRLAVESELNSRIKHSLKDMCKFRNIEFDEKNLNSSTSFAKVKSKPACALVLAVYQSEGWK